MTEREALNLIYGATITPEEWCRRIHYGYKGKPYDYTKTNYFKALVALRGAPTPPPLPGPSGLQALAQNLLFCAQTPLSALEAPMKFKPLLTADPGYAGFNTPSVVAQLRQRFAKVGAWGVQTQIGAQTIRDFAARLGLDFVVMQGETSEEYRTAIEAGAHVIVANPNAWTDAQRADATSRVNAGTLAVSGECYTNLGGPWPKDYSAGGVPVASVCLGVYDGSAETAGGWNPSLAAYKQNTPAGMWSTISVYHAAGVNPSEWGLLA